jgi:hypothetical protein
MAYCRNCGSQMDERAAFCSNCGCAVNTNNYSSPLTDNQFNPYNVNAPVNNGLATASMVLGILGVIFWAVPIIGLAINIVGLVLAAKSRKISNSGKGTAGLVLTIIGLSLTVIYFFNGTLH